MNDLMSEALRAALAAEARSWIGTPYHHRASTKGAGADCLGLIRGVWRACIGAEPLLVPPYTGSWADADGGEPLLTAVTEAARQRFEGGFIACLHDLGVAHACTF